MKIGSSDWKEAYRLLDDVLDLAPAEHAKWLASLAPEKAHLRPLLESMLADRVKIETSDFLKSLPRVSEFIDDAKDVTPASPLAEGKLIGPYRLIRELGMGGMGAVWLAERADGMMKRNVALKLPHAGPMQQQLAQRFARERDILAALAHPHIARLYDAGTTDSGQPYIALEYVEGTPITAYCDEKKLSVDARLALFRQVLAAVQYAHTNLVIHRDLKPSNIMVTHEGYVRLLDFGIAKFLSGERAQETELTQLSGRALTPDYASPEQISGAPISTASDVYSLGVVLYELLVGARPYKLKRGTRGELEEAILSADAPSLTNFINQTESAGQIANDRSSTPVRLKAQLTGEVNTLVRKAIQKQPQNRYATADAFLADIDRYLADQPILAQGETFWYSAKKFVLRNRLPVGAAATVFVALLVGLAATLWQAREVARQADIAREARSRAETSAVLAQTSAALAESQRNRAVAETKRAEESLALANMQSARANEATIRVESALLSERAARQRATQQELVAKDQTRVAKIETAKATAVQNYMLDIFKKNSTDQPDPVKAQQTTVRELLDLGVKEIDNSLVNQPEAKVALIDTFSQLYVELGVREQWVSLAAKKKALAISTYGPESDNTFDATFEHLSAILAQGSRRLSAEEGDAAKSMHNQLVAMLDKRGDRTSIRRSHLLMLACKYRNSGRFGGDATACGKALEILRQHHRDSIEYVETLVEMSSVSASRLEFAKQELFAAEAVEALRKQNRSETAFVEPLGLLVLARLYAFKMKEAEEASIELIKILEGSQTPLAGRILEGYKTHAQLLKSNFRFAEASEVLKRPLAKAKLLYGSSNSLSFRSARGELAGTLALMGDMTAALFEHEQLMADLERDSADTEYHAVSMVFYGAALVKNGDDARARAVLDRAQKVFEKSFGTDAPLPILRSSAMAELELRAGRPQEAFAVLNTTFVRGLSPSPNPSLQVVRRQSLTGRILVAQGRLQEAETAIEPYLKAIEASPVREHLALLEADMLAARGALQTARNEHDAAVDSLKRAATLYARREIPQSPFLAERNLSLVRAYAHAGQRAEALALMQTLQSIHAAVIAPRDHLAKMFVAIQSELAAPSATPQTAAR
jgi:serine/threonine protein kinase